MLASHEWPPPPSSLKSSSMRRKQLSREALAAVDWHKPSRFESYSDGEDDLPSPYSREPLEMACQSSGHGEGKRSAIRSSYGDTKGFVNCNALQSPGYGDEIRITSTNISSSNKEAKVKNPANRRVDHASQQSSAPLWMNACPFPGPLKLAGKTHANRPAMPMNPKNSAFNPAEPFSPEVTCLGRVRIKENHGHNTDHSFPQEDDEERHAHEGRNHVSVEMKQSCKLRSKNEATEKRGCLARRKRRETVSAVAVFEAAETRRERAAVLARSLTSLLEDLRKLEMEKEGYEPAVPPPNSLLLMRGLGSVNKSCIQEITMIRDEGEESNNGSDCENTFDNDLCLPGMRTKMEKNASAEQAFTMESAHMNLQREHEQVLPLSEIKGNSLTQNTSRSEPKSKAPVDHSIDRPQELALWQRRAIAKIDAIDTKMCMKVAGKRPSTN